LRYYTTFKDLKVFPGPPQSEFTCDIMFLKERVNALLSIIILIIVALLPVPAAAGGKGLKKW